MLKRLLRGLLILPVLLLALLLPVSTAAAADLRSGDAVIVASGDVIDDDLYIAATQVVINGTVNGDVLCAGQEITINGKINGSLTAVGGTISIGGQVAHAVRVAGQTVDIRGGVGKDVMVAGGDIQISGTATVGRDLVFAAASKVRIDAPIEDGIKGRGATAILSNRVGGDVDLGVDKLTIESSANIRGNLSYSSKNQATIQPGAQIAGTTTHTVPKSPNTSFPPNFAVGLRILAFFMTLVAGIVIILLVPKRAAAVANSIKRKPWSSLGWGAAIFFAAPIAGILALITVVGIPVGLIGLVTYLIAIYLSQIAVGLFIGYWIIGYFGKVESRAMLVGAFALGFTLLTLVKLIPVVGVILWFATVIFGLGAMALSQRTLGTKPPAAASGAAAS